MLQVIQRVVCEECKLPIEPCTGIIIHGNVYVVSEGIEDRGGIIGNNFPKVAFFHDPELYDSSEVDKDFKFTLDDVHETAMHVDCLMFMLIRNDIKAAGTQTIEERLG